MADLVLISSLCALDDHLGVVNDVEAGSEETNHQVPDVDLAVVAKEPAEESVEGESLHEGDDDAPKEEVGAALAEHGQC